MIGKIIVLILFFIILYNLFMALKYLLDSSSSSDKVYDKLRWRIIFAMGLFVLIVIGAYTGLINLHTL